MGHGAGTQPKRSDAYQIAEHGKSMPYSGSLCEEASVPRGKTYWSKTSATSDCRKLNALNKSVFEVQGHHLQGYFDAYPGR
jgi:hypothetical protein